MKQSGLDDLLCERVTAGDLIYGGWSAGAVVAGPSLWGVHLMDAPEAVAEGYASKPIWEGLGLVDVIIVPHFRSDHPEAEGAEAAVAWLTKEGLPHRALRDGDVMIV